MERALSLAVDDLAEIDISTWSDAAIADEFIALRRDIDRLEAVAARLLVGVHDRLVPFGEGASRTGVGPMESRSALSGREGLT